MNARRPSGSKVSHARREVGRRVAGGHVAEVDHGGQPAVPGDDVRRMQVAVQPERRSGPRRRVQCGPPDGGEGRGVRDQAGGESAGHRIRPRLERHAANRVRGGVRRSLDVQVANEAGELDGERAVLVEGGVRRELSVDPARDAPLPRETIARRAGAHGDRDRHVDEGSDHGEPGVLVLDELRCNGAARDPHGVFEPQPVDRVVPAVRDKAQRQVGEIRMLFGEQRPHERLVDVDVGSRRIHAFRLPRGRRGPGGQAVSCSSSSTKRWQPSPPHSTQSATSSTR